MNIDFIIKFLIETMHDGSDFDQQKLAEFINLSKDEQVLQIKMWAQDKTLKITDQKINLDIDKAKTEARLNAELLELDKITK